MRLGAAAGGAEEEPGQFWKDFIRETAPVFRKPTIEQLEGFIAPTFQALVDGAALRRRPPARDHRRARARRDRRGQRRRLPGAARLRAGRGCGSSPATRPRSRTRRCRRRSPATRSADRTRLGGVLGRVPARASASCTRVRARSAVERGAPPLPRARVHPRVAVAEPLPLSRRGRLPARAARSATLAQPRDERARDRRAVGAAAELRRRRRAARLPQPRLARLGRRRADAAADRRARGRPLPRDRLEWARSTTQLELRRQHGRRGVPAADLDPPAGRPRHHPRRQQHRHRVPPLRQADGRAAAVLGPVRQRPAHRTRPASASGSTPTATSPRSCWRAIDRCWPTRRCAGGSPPPRRACRRTAGRSARPS